MVWKAYVAPFELLATAHGWGEGGKVLQLATPLRSAAVNVLGQLLTAERVLLAGPLQRRFRHQNQVEVSDNETKYCPT